jgi:hypothetical protein
MWLRCVFLLSSDCAVFVVYLHANLTAQRPITKLARLRKTKQNNIENKAGFIVMALAEAAVIVILFIFNYKIISKYYKLRFFVGVLSRKYICSCGWTKI